MKEGNHELFLEKIKSNDLSFNKQLNQANKTTIHCINKMFESIDEKYVIKPKQATKNTKEEFLKGFVKKGFTKLV